MKRWTKLCFVLLALIATGCWGGDQVTPMAASELRERIAANQAPVILDVRSAGEFDAGHVPGATNLPFTDLLKPDGCWRTAAEIRQLLAAALGDATSAPWAVMCGSGVTACHLAVAASLSGISEPRIYVGSWSEWIRDPSRPVATGR